MSGGEARAVLVLGATGNTGSAIAHALARGGTGAVVLGVTDRARGSALARRLEAGPGTDVRFVVVDVTEDDQVRRALYGVTDVVVAVGRPRRLPAIASAAAAAGVDYLDLWYSPAIDEAMRASGAGESGTTALTQCGIQPGLAAPLLRAACSTVGDAVAAEAGTHLTADWSTVTFSPSTRDELSEAVEPLVHRGGHWVRDEKGRPFDFGVRGSAPWGAVYLAELDSVLAENPRLDRLAFGVFTGQSGRHPPPWGASVVARAWSPGAEAVVEVRHHDGFELTALSVVATLSQSWRGWLPRGRHVAGAVVRPVELLADLASLGATVTLGRGFRSSDTREDTAYLAASMPPVVTRNPRV